MTRNIIIYFLVSLLISALAGKVLIPYLTKVKFGQVIRHDGLDSHLKKMGTPTMGGIMFFLPLLMLAFISFENGPLFALIMLTLGFAALGFADDYIKVVLKRSLGLKARYKLFFQIIMAIIFSIYAYSQPSIGSNISVPFLGLNWDFGLLYVPFVTFVLVAASNSVNLTDGLDGLAASTSIVVLAGLAIVSAIALSGIHIVNGEQSVLVANDMLLFSSILAGALFGFLIYNKHPAKVFMGDTGSMGLGAAIAGVFIVLRLPLLLPIMGGMFVIETLSVIVQVSYFKRTGKRIFKMSPLHHHFELCGFAETKIVGIFVLLTMLFTTIGIFSII